MRKNRIKAIAITALFAASAAPALPSSAANTETSEETETDNSDSSTSHVWHATIYQNNDELKACIEAVLLGSSYADSAYKYTKENAQKYYDEHTDKYAGLAIQPNADFAEQVCSHYKVTAKSILNLNGSESESSMDTSQLQSEIENIVGKAGGTWSVYVKDMKTGKTLNVNGDKKLVSASIIKIFIAGAYCQAVEDGKIKDSYGNDLSKMLIDSNNASTNKLIGALGMNYINSFIQKQGCSGTQLNRKMAAAGTENYTTMADCANILEKIEKGTYVSQASSKRIKAIMAKNSSVNKIRKALSSYKGVSVYNKTGEISAGGIYKTSATGDVAIVESSDYPSGLLICINENGITPSSTSFSTLRQVAKKVYEDMKKDS